MKNRTLQITFSILFLAFNTCSGQQNNSPFEPFTNSAEIEVIIKDATVGKAYLYAVIGNQNLIKDSTLVDSSGKVVFKSAKRYPAGLYYAVYSDNSIAGFLLDNNQKFYLHAEKADVINTMKTNSKENEIYYSNQVYENTIGQRQAQITGGLAYYQPNTKEYADLKAEQIKLIDEKLQTVKGYQEKYSGSFFAKFKLMGQNPRLTEPRKPNGDLDTAAQILQYRNDFWNAYDFTDERLLHTPVFYNKLNTYLTTLFPQRVDSVMIGVKFFMDKVDKGNREIFKFTVNYLLLTYKESSVMGSDKIFCYVIDNYYTLKKAYWIDSVEVIRAKQLSDLIKPSLLGAIGQDINCKNEQGVYVNLYSIKKPIRVVYLWNPDCEHCQKETPKLKALYDIWKSKGLEVYALNVEKEVDKWHQYVKEHNLDWINVMDPNYESKYYKKYHIFNTPGLYVLDANNKIVSKQLMPDQLESVFESMIK